MRYPSSPRPWGVLVAVALGLLACRSGEGDRCVCADDCKDNLVCVTEGRVLEPDECSPAIGENADPGLCVPTDEANDVDGGLSQPDVLFDLGSKRDFDPGPPPDPDTDTDTDTAGLTSTGSGSGSGSTGGTSSTGPSSTGTGSTGGTSSSSTDTGASTSTGAGT